MNVRETMVVAATSVATLLAHMYAVVTVGMSSLEMLGDVQVENALQCNIIGTNNNTPLI